MDTLSAAEQRHVVATVVKFYSDVYHADEDPSWIWRTYFFCRQEGAPIPGWVLQGVDGLVRAKLNRKRPAKGRSPRRRDGFDLAVYFHALRTLSPKAKREALAKRTAQKFGTDRATVFRRWATYKHLVDGVKGSLVSDS